MNSPRPRDVDQREPLKRLERLVGFLVGLFVIEFVALPAIAITKSPSGLLFYGFVAAFALTGISLLWLSYRIRQLSSNDEPIPPDGG